MKRVDWTADLEQDFPRKWEIHGDLLMLPGNCFSRLEWIELGTFCMYWYLMNKIHNMISYVILSV